MEISLKKFNSLVNNFNKIKKFASGGSVRFDHDWQKMNHGIQYPYDPAVRLKISDLKFKTLQAAWSYSKMSKIPVQGLDIAPLSKSRTTPGSAGERFYSDTRADKVDTKGIVKKLTKTNGQELAKAFKSMRFIPKEVPDSLYLPFIFQNAPLEVMEGVHTYRLVYTNTPHSSSVLIIGRDDDDIYDYLDKGFFMMVVKEVSSNGNEKRHLVITNQLDVHTMHVFLLVTMDAKLTSFLKGGCFIHSNEAQMVRLKMEKRLSARHKVKYDELRAYIEKDYQNNTSLIVINKLMTGEIEKTSINNITLTKTSATYENLSLEAPDLLDVIYNKINFGGEFDIYSIIEAYSENTKEQVDEKEVAEGTYEFPEIKINGFAVNICKTHTGVRKINGKRINAAEVGKVLYRASCHHSLAEYNLFVARISKMSIRWHDAIANGLPVKMHSVITREEYNSEEPSSTAPAVKFWIDPAARCIKIRVEGDDGGKVSLGRLITKIDTINKKTNDRWSNKAGKSRSWRWAREELAKAIKDCCTHTTVTKNEDGTTNTITTTSVTGEDIKKIIDVADEAKKKAIERSKEFLNSAVKVTGAEQIEFLGKKAFKVQGSLRTYAIVVENAKVYDFDTKQYRCIVNDGHFRGVGYDDIAARLYVLKNDSVMQKKIGTLQGGAQPQYENVHNDYQPERDVTEEIIEKLDLA